MQFKIIYQDQDFLAVDKPAGIVVFPEGETNHETMIEILARQIPEILKAGESPRYGVAHRLDKDTSGILLIAKNTETLLFLQKQFKTGSIQKKYLALATGRVKNDKGIIDTLIGRSPSDGKKQKIFLLHEPSNQGKRQAITEYKVIERFKNYTLLELTPKTGRKHQIRCHLSYLGNPIAGDKVYGFKNQPCPKGLNRQFLHASYIKINMLDGGAKELHSELPEELNMVLQKLIIDD